MLKVSLLPFHYFPFPGPLFSLYFLCCLIHQYNKMDVITCIGMENIVFYGEEVNVAFASDDKSSWLSVGLHTH